MQITVVLPKQQFHEPKTLDMEAWLARAGWFIDNPPTGYIVRHFEPPQPRRGPDVEWGVAADERVVIWSATISAGRRCTTASRPRSLRVGRTAPGSR